MKFCLIGPGIMEIPPKGWGAVESLIWEYSEELKQLGHQVDIINTPDRNEIIKLENSNKYDITHVHYDVFYDILPYLKAKKILISSHYPYIDQPERYHLDRYNEIFNSMVSQSNKFIIGAISSKDANTYIKSGVSPQNIILMPNGVNIKQYHIDHKLNTYSFGAVTLAKIENRKRQYLTEKLLNVFYIGKGPMNHPNYLGELSHEDKCKILTKFGSMVLLSDGENGTPLAIKEGLAAGLNIICSEAVSYEIGDLPFVSVIPENLVYDIEYIQLKIIESTYNNIKDRESIRKYCEDNWSWEKLISDYVKKIQIGLE